MGADLTGHIGGTLLCPQAAPFFKMYGTFVRNFGASRETLNALERFDFTRVIPGHGDVVSRDHLPFFRGYLSDLVSAVKQAAAAGAGLEEMKKGIADQLASKYERGMSKYPLGQFRDRIGLNVEMVYRKVIKNA